MTLHFEATMLQGCKSFYRKQMKQQDVVAQGRWNKKNSSLEKRNGFVWNRTYLFGLNLE